MIGYQMFRYEEQMWSWARYVIGTSGNLSGSSWEFKDKQQHFTPCHDIEDKIEAAVSMVNRVAPVAAEAVRQNYIYCKPKETQNDYANRMGVSLAVFKAKLRKGRMRIAMSVFGDSGF